MRQGWKTLGFLKKKLVFLDFSVQIRVKTGRKISTQEEELMHVNIVLYWYMCGTNVDG